VYQHSKNYAQAEKYYKHSLSTYTSINDSIGIMRALSNLGSLYVNMEKYPLAIKFLKQTIVYAEKNSRNADLATAYNNLGAVYQKNQKYDSAIIFLQRGAMLDSILNLKKEEAIALGNIGVLYHDKSQFEKAIYYLERSIEMTIEVGDKNLTATNYGNLARAYSSAGDFVAAYEAQNNFQQYNDSVYNEEKAKAFTEMQTKYETEKKEKEIVLLNQKNRLQRLQKNIFLGGAIALIIFVAWLFVFFRQKQRIKAQQEAIEKQRAIENVRSRISIDMHDEIGSGLTKLSLMSERVKMKLKTLQNEEEPLLDKISKSSREISGNLSEIIWTVNPKHDNLASMLSYFRNYITKFFEDTSVVYKIDFKDHVPEFQIHPDLKRNLFLVLKESLNNILKYAQAKNVNVHFSLKGNQFNFDITDDGIGMKDLNGREFGNGLKNMKNRIESVNGSFDIQSAENTGTRIFIGGKLYY
ncbi:MAG: tetratricopeptide repeat protein, partial [Chitinophagales bacterium]|nr:tetratricopeptide repeat protein [Chitinophagales bacterium]